MLFVVADQITKGEAVVCGDKIYTGIRAPAVSLVKIARSCNAVRKFADQASIALPIGAHCIAITIVPLGPSSRKLADLIPSFAQVPWLCNELRLRKNGVLLDDVQESTQSIHFVECQRQCGRQIKAEPVHTHPWYP